MESAQLVEDSSVYRANADLSSSPLLRQESDEDESDTDTMERRMHIFATTFDFDDSIDEAQELEWCKTDVKGKIARLKRAAAAKKAQLSNIRSTMLQLKPEFEDPATTAARKTEIKLAARKLHLDRVQKSDELADIAAQIRHLKAKLQNLDIEIAAAVECDKDRRRQMRAFFDD